VPVGSRVDITCLWDRASVVFLLLLFFKFAMLFIVPALVWMVHSQLCLSFKYGSDSTFSFKTKSVGDNFCVYSILVYFFVSWISYVFLCLYIYV
jgi:hypothetical protein